jgi:hypothetical protein
LGKALGHHIERRLACFVGKRIELARNADWYGDVYYAPPVYLKNREQQARNFKGAGVEGLASGSWSQDYVWQAGGASSGKDNRYIRLCTMP